MPSKPAASGRSRTTRKKQEPKYLWALFDRDGDFSYDAVPSDPMTQAEVLAYLDELNPIVSPYKLYRMELVGTLSVNGVMFQPAVK